MNVGSLFSGIGGFDLGLERAGMRVVWQCESDPYRRAVLRRHWPGIPCYEDVRDCQGEAVVEPVDVLCAGVPCQPVSFAGQGRGADDERWMWPDTLRLVRELRPRYVLLENPAALLGRGLGWILGELASSGYDAEWDCLPASAFGAPHRRDRTWIVAYPNADERRQSLGVQPNGNSTQSRLEAPRGDDADGLRTDVADSSRDGEVGNSSSARTERERTGSRGQPEGADDGWWAVEPNVGRVAHGVPARVDRLAALGDALVPQIAEWIGRRILEAEEGRLAA